MNRSGIKERFAKEQSFTLMKPTWPGITWLKLAGLSYEQEWHGGKFCKGAIFHFNETNLA